MYTLPHSAGAHILTAIATPTNQPGSPGDRSWQRVCTYAWHARPSNSMHTPSTACTPLQQHAHWPTVMPTGPDWSSYAHPQLQAQSASHQHSLILHLVCKFIKSWCVRPGHAHMHGMHNNPLISGPHTLGCQGMHTRSACQWCLGGGGLPPVMRIAAVLVTCEELRCTHTVFGHTQSATSHCTERANVKSWSTADAHHCPNAFFTRNSKTI